ncbi:hypothetical protein SAURM35S_07454 [Streptomyces aurantiogriseus]
MSVTTFVVQPIPKALLSSLSLFQDTVTYVLSLRTSISPSAMCRRSLWSIHTWWAPSIWMASKSWSLSFHTPWYASRIVRFRMMTLWTPWPRKKPPPTMCPEVPDPTIVLSEATLISLPTGFMLIVAATTMTYGSEAVAYFSRSARVFTVTVLPSRPPYVPF